MDKIRSIYHKGQPRSATIRLIQQPGLPWWPIKGCFDIIIIIILFFQSVVSVPAVIGWWDHRGAGAHDGDGEDFQGFTRLHQHHLLLLPSSTCPPKTPSTVNYPHPDVIDGRAGSWHQDPQLKNDKCSPSASALGFVCLSHRPSFKSIDPKNRWPQPCLHQFWIIDKNEATCVREEACGRRKRAGDFGVKN